jgi:hypothetical protein
MSHIEEMWKKKMELDLELWHFHDLILEDVQNGIVNYVVGKGFVPVDSLQDKVLKKKKKN